MDKGKLRGICQKILDRKNISILDFNVVRTNRLNEVGVWEESSYCVFLTINDNDHQKYDRGSIDRMLESIFGFEFILKFS